MFTTYLHFFASITYGYLAIYVLLKNPREKLNQVCSLIFICMLFWSFHYIFRDAPGVSRAEALSMVKYSAIGWIGLGPAVLWFHLFFTGYCVLLQRHWFVALTVIPAIIMLAAQWQNKMIYDLSRSAGGWSPVWSGSLWTVLFLIYFSACLFISVGILFYFIRSTSRRSKKKQGQIIFYPSLPVILLGALTDVVAPITGVSWVPPLADVFILIWAYSLAYAILRYKLMIISPATAAENIISTMSDLLILTGTRLQILTVNNAAMTTLGYCREEIEGLNFRDLLCSHDPTGKIFSENMDLRNIDCERLCLKTNDNEELPVILSSSILKDQDGRSAGLVMVAKDIREQIRIDEEKRILQDQLIKAQRLEAIGTLAGGLAHDLNNILGGIVSYPDLLLHDMPQDHPMYKPIAAIQKSGQKAVAIVEDLLAMARRGVLKTTIVDLNELVTDFLNSPECSHIKRLNPKVEVKVIQGLELWPVNVSTYHICKVLMNLLSNGLEAIAEEGAICIETRNQLLLAPLQGYETIPKGRYTAIAFSDNGAGIERSDLEHIFEPFYTKKTMGRSGTGLGMFVVWGTVKDHKGYIDLNSRESEGTTVTVYLPAAETFEQEEPHSPPKKPVMRGKQEHILVVDDVAEQRELAVYFLTNLGYQVSAVSDGLEAVSLVQKNGYDLVLLDMIMDPGIDGLETYRRMCDIRPGQKAVVATGFAESKRVEQVISLGAYGFLQKPYTLQDIAGIIREALDAPAS